MKKGLLVLAFSCAAAFSTVACRWTQPPAFQVAPTGDADTAYAQVRATLVEDAYPIAEEKRAERLLRVLAIAERSDPEKQSWISIQVNADGSVVLDAVGYMVRDDGRMHRTLVNEIEDLHEQIREKLASGAPVAPAPAATAEAPAPAQTPAIPAAWVEVASDQQKWGTGKFTCLPIALVSDQAGALGIRLSDGSLADIAVSIAYAPELCRATPQCPLPAGCPALGLGDSDQVQRLAQLLASSKITSQATLVTGQTSLATLNLSEHGSIAEALVQAP